LSILKSKEYSGKEIGAIQVLNDFGLNKIENKKIDLDLKKVELIKIIIQKINMQYSGWISRNIFEKQ
jgi:hypothetical protein